MYGENGTGKSTIADAFDLLGNGRVGSLDTRGLGTTRKYSPPVGKAAADVSVAFETSSGRCNVALGTTEVVVQPQSLQPPEIGRASLRERVWRDVWTTVGSGGS